MTTEIVVESGLYKRSYAASYPAVGPSPSHLVSPDLFDATWETIDTIYAGNKFSQKVANNMNSSAGYQLIDFHLIHGCIVSRSRFYHDRQNKWSGKIELAHETEEGLAALAREFHLPL